MVCLFVCTFQASPFIFIVIWILMKFYQVCFMLQSLIHSLKACYFFFLSFFPSFFLILGFVLHFHFAACRGFSGRRINPSGKLTNRLGRSLPGRGVRWTLLKVSPEHYGLTDEPFPSAAHHLSPSDSGGVYRDEMWTTMMKTGYFGMPYDPK